MEEKSTVYLVLQKRLGGGLCTTHKGTVFNKMEWQKKAGPFTTEADAARWIRDVCDSGDFCD